LQESQSFQEKILQLYRQAKVRPEKRVLQNHPKFSELANEVPVHQQPIAIQTSTAQPPRRLGNHPLLRLK